MTKNFFIVFATAGFIFSGCRQGGKNTDTASGADSVTAAIETVAIKKTPVQSELQDPDSTDTISADRYGINTYGKQTVELVKMKLKEMYKDDLLKNIIPDVSRKFILFEYDLNDDAKKEIFVGLTGSYFCGSGGCTLLLLNNDGSLITKFTVIGYPVIIASSNTRNWKDLILYSSGKNHLMKFNGKAYPSNPSLQPDFKLIPGDDLPRLLDFTNEPYPRFTF